MSRFAKADVLILDDWSLAPLGDQQRRDVFEVLEDRHGMRSTVVTSQLPIDTWHHHIGSPIVADAVLDRLARNGHKLTVRRLTTKGEGSHPLSQPTRRSAPIELITMDMVKSITMPRTR